MKILSTLLLATLATGAINAQTLELNYKGETATSSWLRPLTAQEEKTTAAFIAQINKTSKPTYSDYVILPNGKLGSGFEIHDRELTTLNGNIVTLSTTNVSSNLFKDLPASTINGAAIALRSVYRQDIFGSGNIPWLTMLAPTVQNEPSIALNTYANLYPDNKIGSFTIHTDPSNGLTIATIGDGAGKIGWLSPANTSLTLSAEKVYATGDLYSGGNIYSSKLICVGDKLNNVKITSLGISIINKDNSYYIGADKQYGSWVLQSADKNMMLNAISTGALNNRSISIAFDFKNTVVFTSTEVFLLKPFSRQKMHDWEILAIQNPTEGQEVYSLDQHAPVFFNSKDWMIYNGVKKLEIPRTNKKLNL